LQSIAKSQLPATTASSIRCRTHYQKRQLRNQAQLLVICQFTLGDALAGKTSHAVELFRKIAAMMRRFGAVEIVPQ